MADGDNTNVNTYLVGLQCGTRFIITAHGYYESSSAGRSEYVFVLHGPNNRRTLRSFDATKITRIERYQAPVRAA